MFLFIVVPIVEIALFVQVGGFLGMWPTIGLVLVTAIVGASLVRSQGIATLEENQHPTQLINAADSCLYRAKELGRNQFYSTQK